MFHQFNKNTPNSMTYILWKIIHNYPSFFLHAFILSISLSLFQFCLSYLVMVFSRWSVYSATWMQLHPSHFMGNTYRCTQMAIQPHSSNINSSQLLGLLLFRGLSKKWLQVCHKYYSILIVTFCCLVRIFHPRVLSFCSLTTCIHLIPWDFNRNFYRNN